MLMPLVVGPDLENIGGVLKNMGSVRCTQATAVTPNSELKSGHIFFLIINLSLIAGCSIAFFWDISPRAQLTKNPRILLSLEGVTPLPQAKKFYIDYFLKLLLPNTRGRCWRLVPHLRARVNYRVVLTGPSTCWSKLTSRLGLYYSFLPFTFPHMAIFHQRTPTVPRRLSPGEFSSSTTPCAKSSPPLWILSPSGQTNH